MKAGMIVSLLAMAAMTTAGKPGSLTSAPDRAPERVAVDTTVIEVYASEEGLAFDPSEIRAKAGSIVKLRFVNPTMLPHNIVILKSAKDLDAIGEASFAAAATGFVPMQHKSKMVGYSPLAHAGKTVDFTFTVPPAGEYLFVCFVDGHFNAMVGKLRSRP